MPTRRLLALVLPVTAAGLAVLAVAIVDIAVHSPSATWFAGVAALLAASTVAERFPVPLEGVDAGGVSLSFVFGIGAIILYGWAAGVVVCFAAPALMQLFEHRPPMRVAYNSASFGIAAAVTGGTVAEIGGYGHALALQVALAGSVEYVANMALVAPAVAVSSRRPLREILPPSLRSTALPFALMTSTSLVLVVLWQRSPAFAAALIGPLLAIGLYQRSNYRALRATKLALTDPLTGLGNHRHFQDRLERALQRATDDREPLTLCLLDVDDFKRINDNFGHPAGDRVLRLVASRLRQNGETFRLGGDEFAILLPGKTDATALEVAAKIVERIGKIQLDEIGWISVSAGIATFPSHAQTRADLIGHADSALYWAKEHGKNCVRVYRPPLVEFAQLKHLAQERDVAARFHAAASLAQAVDARDTYTGGHSTRVAELAARIADRLGLDDDLVELVRLGGNLHDLGKLVIPEELLRKPGPLTDAERVVLERHPQIGYKMLESLGVDPVASWVLHHHEHWDGGGYPDGLTGNDIPLGARIILVADAYDAMTSDRSYRLHMTVGDALAELRRCSGSQFDPDVVDALAEELDAPAGLLHPLAEAV